MGALVYWSATGAPWCSHPGRRLNPCSHWPMAEHSTRPSTGDPCSFHEQGSSGSNFPQCFQPRPSLPLTKYNRHLDHDKILTASITFSTCELIFFLPSSTMFGVYHGPAQSPLFTALPVISRAMHPMLVRKRYVMLPSTIWGNNFSDWSKFHCEWAGRQSICVSPHLHGRHHGTRERHFSLTLARS